MKKLPIFVLKVLLLGSIIYLPTFAQNADTLISAPKKPTIIFNKTDVDTSKKVLQDTAKAKILFHSEPGKNSELITLVSKEVFRYKGKQHMIGKNGEHLIEIIKSNPTAVEMVKSAYSSRITGLVMMILGGVSAIVVTAISPSVTLSESETTKVQWYPGITAGVLLGGWGYVLYNGLEADLRKAIQVYNDSL